MSSGSLRSTGGLSLPGSVWEIIATKMPLHEWAKASGTCRATRAVRLAVIEVPRDWSAPGDLFSPNFFGNACLVRSLQPARKVPSAQCGTPDGQTCISSHQWSEKDMSSRLPCLARLASVLASIAKLLQLCRLSMDKRKAERCPSAAHSRGHCRTGYLL